MAILQPEIRGRGIYLLPNLFTIAALFAGFYAIVAALKGSYDNAAIAIFVAMIMDGLDGRVARLTNTVTAFGAELDSLSDMVSFGVAPAVSIYSWALVGLGKTGWLAAFVYVVAVALRLARFNTQIGGEKRYFQGLSSTAGAGLMAAILWVGVDFDLPTGVLRYILAFITVVAGVLMVSNIRYRSFKDMDLKHHVPFVVILVLVLTLVLISLDPSLVLLAIFSGYAISGPVSTVWGIRKRKLQRRKVHDLHKKAREPHVS